MSLPAFMTLESRREAREAVKHPGKFEGEPAIVALLWEASMEGADEEISFSDELDYTCRMGRWLLYQSPDGFVGGERCASKAEAEAKMNVLMEEYS